MSWLKAYAVAITSLLTGAAVVHNIYKPDLVRFFRQHKQCPSGSESHSERNSAHCLQTLPVSDDQPAKKHGSGQADSIESGVTS